MRSATEGARLERTIIAFLFASHSLMIAPMPKLDPKRVAIAVSETTRVSGLLLVPPKATACYVLAHGAGAGMAHPFLATVASELYDRNIATLRYQFPYMEAKSKRPDPPRVAQATVRAAVQEAARLAPRLPLIAGGKSFGGRMTSQAQAAQPLPNVHALIFLGFPLHAAGRPSHDRAAHLSDIRIPMLFLQGTRDALADLTELNPVIASLGKRATLKLIADADHSFHVPAKTGRKDSEVVSDMMDALTAFAAKVPAK